MKCYEHGLITRELKDFLREFEYTEKWNYNNTSQSNIISLIPSENGRLYQLITIFNDIIATTYSELSGNIIKYYSTYRVYTDNADQLIYDPYFPEDNKDIELAILQYKRLYENTRFKYDKEKLVEETNIEQALKQTDKQIFKVLRGKDKLTVFCKQIDFSQFCKILALNIHFIFKKYETPQIIKDIQKCLTHLAYNSFTDLVKTLNKIDFATQYKKTERNELIKAFKSYENSELRALENDISSATSHINHLTEKILQTIETQRKNKERYQFLKENKNTQYNEIVDYILQHKYIYSAIPYDQNSLMIHIKSPIIYYDIDCVERIWKNLSSDKLLYTVFDEVFIKQKYELWSECKIKFNTVLLLPKPFEEHTDKNTKLFKHPHMSEFLCMGTHLNEITKWANNKDYIGALEQTIAATQNLNFTDGYVIDNLKRTIVKYRDIPTFKNKENGNMYTANEIERMVTNE